MLSAFQARLRNGNGAVKPVRRGAKAVTIEALEAYGADVNAGLARCLGMQDFYLKLVDMELKDENFERLDRALAAQDVREAFEYGPLSEITEKLRNAQGPVALDGLEDAYRNALEGLKALD